MINVSYKENCLRSVLSIFVDAAAYGYVKQGLTHNTCRLKLYPSDITTSWIQKLQAEKLSFTKKIRFIPIEIKEYFRIKDEFGR